MGAPTVALLSNCAWNLAHFRRPIIADLVAGGARVVAIAPFDGNEKRLRGLGAETLDVPLSRSGLNPLDDLRLLAAYRHRLRQIRPDIVLGFTAKPNIWGSIAASGLGIPVINNVSGLGTAFIGRAFLGRLVSALYRRALRRSHTVFFQNSEDRDRFVEAGLVDAATTSILPGSGVDLDYFQPQTRPRPSDGVTRFLYIGRLLRDKGLVELAEASRLLRQAGHRAEVVLLGAEDPANRSAIPSPILAQWAAEGLVVRVGHQDDIRPHVAASHCVVLPSYREGLPKSVIEAAAMARPAIVTNVPGCRQAIVEGRTGLLCEPRDGRSLAQAMERFIGLDRPEREAMETEARRFAEQTFSQQRVVQAYREAIADALNKASARS